jgi:uncharacterized membrane protein YgcG
MNESIAFRRARLRVVDWRHHICAACWGIFLASAVVGGVTGGIGWMLLGGHRWCYRRCVLAGMFLAIFGLDLVMSGMASRWQRRWWSLVAGGGGGFGGGGGSGGGGGASGSW